ncbi:hypothetical protein [Halopiger djelfimassiliensis]|uniref:hypothetical protein n=1 Tax=Halopiger djelfimassiliensis TaxID=1293047 RepID=UPI0006782F65|nr:hypothetical protein [Halopiger djelfimassiliensis]
MSSDTGTCPQDDIASEVADTSASVEEIASTAEAVAATSERAQRLSEEGQHTAVEATEVMEQVDDSARSVATDVDELVAEAGTVATANGKQVSRTEEINESVRALTAD